MLTLTISRCDISRQFSVCKSLDIVYVTPNTTNECWSPFWKHFSKLFIWGVSGEPKAVPWTQHTPLRCAIDGWMHLDLKIGSVLCWPTNLGWMVGPMILAASFMNGATLALYNGSPLGRGFGKFVQASQIK